MSGIYASLRQAQILILAILNVFLWLKFSPSLILSKIEHFETASLVMSYFCKFSKTPGKYWDHAGLFFKGRKALPHFIERRISLKIHLRTAP